MQINRRNWRILRLLIFVFAAATVIVIAIAALHNRAKEEPVQKLEEIPEIRVTAISKCLVLSSDENGISILWDGQQKNLVWDDAYAEEKAVPSNTVADITLTNDKVTDVISYAHKINAKLLEIRENENGTSAIELSGYGTMQGTEDLQVYKLFGSVESYTLADLVIGYAFTDFVFNEDGKIVAALAMQQAEMDKIRVLIKTADFEAPLHERVELSCDGEMTITAQQLVTDENATVSENAAVAETVLGQLAGGEKIEITMDSELFEASNRIFLTPKALSDKICLLSLTRNQGTPSYYGVIEIEKTPEGLVIVNELPLEEYLYSVVPSEMPSSYPPEALKAQAVCARTYAYTHMLHAGLQKYGAHVDDSAAFQVYNNIAESGNTTLAVRDTEGKIMYNGESVLTAYFYSTSCGYGTDLSAWNLKYDDIQAATEGYLLAGAIAPAQAEAASTEAGQEQGTADLTQEETFAAYIRSVDADAYEKDDTYYRWCYETELDAQLLLANLQARYERDPEDILTKSVDTAETEHFVSLPITSLGDILSMTIQKRSTGGVATELLIEGTKNTILARGEQNIRYILAGASTAIKLGSGYEKTGAIHGMLPSSFLTLDLHKEDADDQIVTAYTVYGGGFGHGIGMSQNGARAMALAGKSCDEILHMFYQFQYKE